VSKRRGRHPSAISALESSAWLEDAAPTALTIVRSASKIALPMRAAARRFRSKVRDGRDGRNRPDHVDDDESRTISRPLSFSPHIMPDENLPPTVHRYPRLGAMAFDTFREHLSDFLPELAPDTEIIAGASSPLAAPLIAGRLRASNRWTIHPMEGWDGESDGKPSDLTRQRWRRFGESGAKLIWGGEAVAVREDGRANPRQLVLSDATLPSIADLREELLRAHISRFGSKEGLVVGLQLTHSGRFCRPGPTGAPAPRIAYRHPILDRRAGVTSDAAVLSDAEIETLIAEFIQAARRASDAGFDFVDVKHCHGYLLHELLGAHTRAGPYGGSFENRTRALRSIITGIREAAPTLEIGVRIGIFDVIPFRPGPRLEGIPGAPAPGVPEEWPAGVPYRFGFGVDPDDPRRGDTSEGFELLQLLDRLGVAIVNISGGSPYYNPHVQRPALYPPSDGYGPPEDPTAGVVRQLRAARDVKRACPKLAVVASALSYLQEFLPHVAQAAVREGWIDSPGIGRMVLSYWDLPADCLERGEIDKKRLCRTLSDCTTAPRNGLISGCYPLDPFYRSRPEAKRLRELKSGR
jgi:NADPH2 dehydrogenase